MSTIDLEYDRVLQSNGSYIRVFKSTENLDFGKELSSGSLTGDISGPALSTDNALVRWDGTTGKIIQNSLGILSDLGDLTSLTGLEVDGSNNINLTSTLNSDPSIVINSNHALGSIELQQEGTNRIKINTTGLGFFNSVPIAKPTIVGDCRGNLALTDLLSDLHSIGLVNNTTTPGVASTGDVVGPASATNNALVRFDTATGKLIQNSVAILSDLGVLSSLTGLESTGAIDFDSVSSFDLLSTAQTNIESSQAASDAVYIHASNAAGGILLDATAGVRFNEANVGGIILDDSTSLFDTTIKCSALNSENHTITLPPAFPTVNGQVLSSTTAGITSWVAQSTGDVTFNAVPGAPAINEIVTFSSVDGLNIRKSGPLINGKIISNVDSISINVNTAGNLAYGFDTLNAITTGENNSCFGQYAMGSGPTALEGDNNTAIGVFSQYFLTTGDNNAASGYGSLYTNDVGNNNTAVGVLSLDLCKGDNNISIGYQAGNALTLTDSNNIIIGNTGTAGDNQKIRIGNAQTNCFIKGIHNVTPAVSSTEMVIINSNGELGSQTIPTGSSDYPPGYLDGGGIEWVSNSTVNVMPVSCRDTGDSYNIVLGANALLNMAITGSAGGMQVAESSNQMYKVYVIADSNEVNSTAAWGVPQGTAISLPATHDKFRFMGHIKNNSSSNILHFQMFNKGRSRMYHYHESRSDLEVYSGAGTSGVFQNLDLDLLVPLEVDTCDFSVELDMDADTHKFYMQSGLNPQSVANSLVVYGSGIQAADFGFSDFTVYNQAIDRSGGTLGVPSVEWATDVTGQDVTISVSSYIQNL